jgi:hypothetical protein
MHSGDHEEFKAQLKALCAGYNVPFGDRGDAYWRGLEKMDLGSFARVVEFCLGEGGPDKIPTTGQCWAISKQLRARPRLYEHEKPTDMSWTGDAWDRAANHHLSDYIQTNVRLRANGRYGTSRYVGPGIPLGDRSGNARARALPDRREELLGDRHARRHRS